MTRRRELGREVAALADRVVRPVGDDGHQLPLAPVGGVWQHDVDLVHGRLYLGVALVAPLGDDLNGIELLEQSLREPINLRFGGFSAREDTEVDDELRTSLSLASKNQCRIGHAPLIPSRGSHLNIRAATTSPNRPQTSTAASAPGEEVSVSPSMKVDRLSRMWFVSGSASESTSRKRGRSRGE